MEIYLVFQSQLGDLYLNQNAGILKNNPCAESGRCAWGRSPNIPWKYVGVLLAFMKMLLLYCIVTYAG